MCRKELSQIHEIKFKMISVLNSELIFLGSYRIESRNN